MLLAAHIPAANDPAHSTAGAIGRRVGSEAGFGLIELIIVALVVSIVAAGALTSMFGARSAAQGSTLRASTIALDGAVRAFRRDHSGRTPDFSDPADWKADKSVGPIDRQQQAYMRRRDEALATGTIAVVTGTPSSAGTMRIRYERPSSTTYRLLAEQRTGATWKLFCWSGTSAPASEGLRC